MTDEEAHKDTALWPSEANIVRCYSSLSCTPIPNWIQMHSLRNLVRDAYPGDAFVFFCEYIFNCVFSRPSPTDLIVCSVFIRRWTLWAAASDD